MKHTPGPWKATESYNFTGTFVAYIGTGRSRDHQIAQTRGTIKEVDEANARLIAAAPTAPHECDVPDCPGNINRRKLEAFPDLLEAARGILLVAQPLGNAKYQFEKSYRGMFRVHGSRLENLVATIAKATENNGGVDE